MRTGPFAALLGATVVLLALLLYFPTLGSAYAYDDMDYINQAADAMAGQRGFFEVLFRPQGEHIVAGFRLILHGSLKLFGIDAFPYRLLVLFAHAASAFFLGLLARHYSKSDVAGLAAGVVYVGACGFSSMWVWFPSGGTVPFALALITGGLLALAKRGRHARLIAGTALVAALLTESTLAPMSALLILLDEYERRRDGKPRTPVGAFSVFCVVATVAVAGLASYLYTKTFGPGLDLSIRHGIPRFVFLVLVAPFRLFFPGFPILASTTGLPTGIKGSLLGMAVAVPILIGLFVLWRRGIPRLAWIAALLVVGPLGSMGLVGLGRWRNSYWELYDADRYFFTLLVPISLLAGAVAASVAERVKTPRARTALLLVLAVFLSGEFFLHRRAMLHRIPWGVYQAHENRFWQLERLARRLKEAAGALPAGSPPVQVPDTAIWLPEVHNGHVNLRTVLHVMGRGPGERIRLTRDPVSERDARILNPVLDAWAREVGEPLPYLSIRDGKLMDAHTIAFVDFRREEHSKEALSGFYPWEGTYRWMAKKGEIGLVLRCREVALVLATATEALKEGPLEIQVTVIDEQIKFPAPIGKLRVAKAEARNYPLDALPFLVRLGAGRRVRLALESDRTWRPVDRIAGSGDTRELSVQVQAAGCEP